MYPGFMQHGFHAIFSEDPPACDIVRKDFIRQVNEETKQCVFRCEVARNVYDDIHGKIVASGYKKDLIKINVNKHGIVETSDPKVGTRKQEIERERLAQKNASALNQQEGAEMLLDEGLDAALRTLKPVQKTRRTSLPKPRREAYLNALRAEINKLPCFHAGNGKTRLWKDKNVYCSNDKLAAAKMKFSLNPSPKDFFKTLLRAILPRRILLIDGISATGKRGCVKIPQVVDAILLYVLGCYQKKGGNVEDVQFDPNEILKTRINNAKKKWGTVTLTIPSTTNLSTTNPSSPITSNPSTSNPSTSNPLTSNPSTSNPLTSSPSTPNPSTPIPSTSNPSTSNHSTSNPSTPIPSTSYPSSPIPATSNPSSPIPLPTTPPPTISSSIRPATSPDIIIVTRDKNDNIFTTPNREHNYYDMSFSHVQQDVSEKVLQFENF